MRNPATCRWFWCYWQIYLAPLIAVRHFVAARDFRCGQTFLQHSIILIWITFDQVDLGDVYYQCFKFDEQVGNNDPLFDIGRLINWSHSWMFGCIIQNGSRLQAS